MPLHYASKHGLSEVVQVLLSHGATVDINNSTIHFLLIIFSFQKNQTPLHFASEHGHSEVVQVLLSHGATLDMKDEVSFQIIQNALVCRKLVPQMFQHSTGILNCDK